MEVKSIGVVGLGLMGSGIAEIAARAGLATHVREVDEATLQAGMGRLRSSLEKAVARGKLPAADAEAALGRVVATTRIEELAGADLVVEAVTEDPELKRSLFRDLDRACKPETILATNTSSCSVTELMAATSRPDRVAGLHFFNPVPVMKLVEIVRTIATSDEVTATLTRFATAVGKEPILAQDRSGFIVNRLLVPYLLDAVRALEDGFGSVEDIDRGMTLGCGHPMGPFRLLDLVGLDTTLSIAAIMFDEYHERRFAAPPLLKRMVAAGRIGRKAGRGFYDYGGDR